MDLIQSLMLFMAVTYSTAVTVAAPPSEMPSPTLTPYAYVAPAPTDSGDPASLMPVTPAPATATPSPTPAPTITPNPAYRILRRGDKGEEVRRMQQRLMELGFLNGNIDGVFGYQTYAAVLAFQKANGLTRDGEAGPATLTRLFEDPNVTPNLAVLTPTPEPTATPRPDGLVPIPEDGTASWEAVHLHTVLYNNASLTIPREGYPSTAPQLWLRRDDLMLSLEELSMAAGWTLVVDRGENFNLQAEGYDLDGTVLQSALDMRPGENGYLDAFSVTDAGRGVRVAQGDIVSENGKWYVSATFLRNAMRADVVWDEDENTLIIRIARKNASHSND